MSGTFNPEVVIVVVISMYNKQALSEPLENKVVLLKVAIIQILLSKDKHAYPTACIE